MAEDTEAAKERRDALLEAQREALSHFHEWIRFRSLTQKHIANGLGVNEGTLSRYLSGETLMSVGHLRKIAFLLGCHVGDLLRPPPSQGLGPLVEDTLAEMDRIGPERWRRILEAAREMKDKDG